MVSLSIQYTIYWNNTITTSYILLTVCSVPDPHTFTHPIFSIFLRRAQVKVTHPRFSILPVTDLPLLKLRSTPKPCLSATTATALQGEPGGTLSAGSAASLN